MATFFSLVLVTIHLRIDSWRFNFLFNWSVSVVDMYECVVCVRFLIDLILWRFKQNEQ
jgi:hypothetical protein